MRRSDPSSSKKTQIALLCVAIILILSGLWWSANHQLEAMNRSVNDIAELKDPSPFRAALMGHLGKIHLGMEGYLHTPDPALLEQVSQSQKDFDVSTPEFARQNPKLFPKVAVEEIHRTFGLFKESITQLLETRAKRQVRRDALDQNFTRIITLIERNIRPLIRNDQAESEERSETILNVVNQARAWQQNLAIVWAQPSQAAMELTFENDNRGETYLERYSRLELLPRERKLAKEIRGLWQANSNLARESFAVEKVVTDTKAFMEGQRQQVIQALNKYLPALPPAEFEAKKNGFAQAIRLHLGAAGVIALLGIVILVLGMIGMGRLRRGERLWTPRAKAGGDAPAVVEPTLQMDLKGTVNQWTAAAEKIYGYNAKEMKGASISKLFESESEISRLYQDLLEAPHTTFETIHKVKAGHAVPVRIEFRPITDSSGKATAIGLVVTRR